MRKSKAAVCHKTGGPFVLEDIEVSDPGPGEVLVRMVASGVCHSDWGKATGKIPTDLGMPAVYGHEGAGIVEELGPGVTKLSQGDHVMLSWITSCGACYYCQRDLASQCEKNRNSHNIGRGIDGQTRLWLNGQPLTQFGNFSTFTEYAVVPEQACISLDPEVSFKSASLVSCAVMTGIGSAVYTAKVKPGEKVAVFGCGGVGLNIIQGAAICGAELIVGIDKFPSKLESAKQFGANHTIDANEDVEKILRDLTDGRGVDHTFDSTGNPAVQEIAILPLRRRGTLTLVGVAPHDAKVTFDTFRMHCEETKVQGCFYGTGNNRRDFLWIIELYKSGRIKLDELISKVYPLEQINEVFEDMLSGKINRGVLSFN